MKWRKKSSVISLPLCSQLILFISLRIKKIHHVSGLCTHLVLASMRPDDTFYQFKNKVPLREWFAHTFSPNIYILFVILRKKFIT